MKSISFNQIRESRTDVSQEELDAAFKSALTRLPLASLRSEAGITQTEMAKRLKKSQAAVSKFEARGDFLVSTLVRHVQALGGELDICIKLKSCSYHLKPEEEFGELVFSLLASAESCSEGFSLPELANQYRAGKVHSSKTYNRAKWGGFRYASTNGTSKDRVSTATVAQIA